MALITISTEKQIANPIQSCETPYITLTPRHIAIKTIKIMKIDNSIFLFFDNFRFLAIINAPRNYCLSHYVQINYSINGEHSQLFDNVKNDNGTVAGAKRLAALSVKWICCKRKIKNSDKTESSIAVLFGGTSSSAFEPFMYKEHFGILLTLNDIHNIK